MPAQNAVYTPEMALLMEDPRARIAPQPLLSGPRQLLENGVRPKSHRKLLEDIRPGLVDPVIAPLSTREIIGLSHGLDFRAFRLAAQVGRDAVLSAANIIKGARDEALRHNKQVNLSDVSGPARDVLRQLATHDDAVPFHPMGQLGALRANVEGQAWRPQQPVFSESLTQTEFSSENKEQPGVLSRLRTRVARKVGSLIGKAQFWKSDDQSRSRVATSYKTQPASTPRQYTESLTWPEAPTAAFKTEVIPEGVGDLDVLYWLTRGEEAQNIQATVPSQDQPTEKISTAA